MWEGTMRSTATQVHAVAKILHSIPEMTTTNQEDINPAPFPTPTTLHPSHQRNRLCQSTLNFPTAQKASIRNPYPKNISPTPNSISIQTKISKSNEHDNEWIGAKICKLTSGEVRLWLQNVNGIDISHNFNVFMEQLQYIQRYNISFLSITEAKLNPYSSYITENIESAFKRVYEEGSCILSNQYINNDDTKQYGGVFSASMNEISQRVASMGKDKLGRFNWIDFYGSSNFLRIYTVYRVNPGSDPTSGDDTCWTHQRSALLAQNCTTDPRKQVVIDLQKHLQEDIKLHRSILICGDINEDVFSTKGFNASMTELGLTNLIEDCVGSLHLRTHNRGNNIIDGIWASPNMLSSVVRCGIAPFNFLFSSDHRGVFLDLNLKSFLDLTTPHVSPPAYRRLKYTVPKRVQEYTTTGISLWKLQKMDLRVDQLETILPTLDTLHKALLLNKIDIEINNLMTASEKRCCSVGRHCDTLFSGEFKKALRCNRQCKTQLSKALMNLGNGFTTETDVKSIVLDLRQTKCDLKKCKKNSDSHREQLFDKLAQDTLHMHPQRGKKNAPLSNN